MRFIALGLALVGTMGAVAATGTLTREEYADHMLGAWAGQMFGVCFGAPWEFQSNGAMITKDLGEWKPEDIKNAIGQDDCYVEMTFLKALETYGLDITYEEAGKAFGESQYPLWHANNAGRNNIRRGIMPPKSGNPEYNLHADDIDFQIEADLFGILCPGMPRESNRLCEIFGHVMNYGDGVYGGMFVAGMYTAAYFEPNDVEKVISAGLACIPKASAYYQTITDVMAWHAEHPDDWQKVWQLIEDKYQDDVDCEPGNKFNINANLNGAYIVMGLLYGGGDMMKTAEMSVRCGQDADCNPSNACGVLGCMKGLSKLPDETKKGILAMSTIPFDHTEYSFVALGEACEKMTQLIVQKADGIADEEHLKIRVQRPRAPRVLEQWTGKKEMISVVIPASDIQLWNEDFTLVACGHDMEPGLLSEYAGEKNVLRLHPVDREHPAILRCDSYRIRNDELLSIPVGSDERGDFVFRVRVDGVAVLEKIIDTHGKLETVEVFIGRAGSRRATLDLEFAANGWSWEAGYVGRISSRLVPRPPSVSVP